MSWTSRKMKCCGGERRKHKHPGEPGWCYCVRLTDAEYEAWCASTRRGR